MSMTQSEIVAAEFAPVHTVFIGSRNAYEAPATLIRFSDEPFGRLRVCISFESYAQALDFARSEVVDLARRRWRLVVDERDRAALVDAVADLEACGLLWSIVPTDLVDVHGTNRRAMPSSSNIV